MVSRVTLSHLPDRATARRTAAVRLVAIVVFFAACRDPLPPDTPQRPWGPASYISNFAIGCTTAAADPGGSRVEYQFDWGDNTTSDWSEPVESGIPYGRAHYFARAGEFDIRARARNRHGLLSDWSESHSVSITQTGGWVPSTPEGPDVTYRRAPTEFKVMVEAPRGLDVRFVMHWGDGPADTTADSFESGETTALDHDWEEAGEYEVRAQAMLAGNPDQVSDVSPPAAIAVLANGEPSIPTLIAPRNAVVNLPVLLRASASDPDQDSVSVRFDFGDGDTGDWTALVPSGGMVRDSHVYTRKQDVEVRCQARDSKGSRSDWSRSALMTVGEAGAVRWYWWTELEFPPISSPLVAKAGSRDVVYSGFDDGSFCGIDADGRLRYTAYGLSPDGSFTGHPGFCEQTGHIVVGNDAGRLHALTTSLQRDWTFPDTGVVRYDREWGTPAVSGNRIYVPVDDTAGGRHTTVVCLLEDAGAAAVLLGAYGLHQEVADAPVVDRDGYVLVGTVEGLLYRLTPGLNTIAWVDTLDPLEEIRAPAVGTDGTLYVATSGGRLYSVRPDDGGVNWMIDLGDGMAQPAVGNDGLYVGTAGGLLLRVRFDGSVEWLALLGEEVLSTPALAADGHLFCQDAEDVVYCIDRANGDIVWWCDCPSAISLDMPGAGGRDIEQPVPSPTILPSGDVVVAGEDALYCVKGYRGSVLLAAPWPKWQRDSHNTGAAVGH